jgi:hypothetical protein
MEFGLSAPLLPRWRKRRDRHDCMSLELVSLSPLTPALSPQAGRGGFFRGPLAVTQFNGKENTAILA